MCELIMMAGSNLLDESDAKHPVGYGSDGAKTTQWYTGISLKTKIFYGYLNRHIFMRNTEKETTVTPSRRIDKCPTLGHRFSDKFPTTGTDKMTNAREGMGTLGINRGIDWATKFSHVDLTSAWVVYQLPQILGNSGWDVNGKRFFGSSHWKIPGTNGNSGKAVPFPRLGRSEWKFVYHLQVSWVSSQFQVVTSIQSSAARQSGNFRQMVNDT